MGQKLQNNIIFCLKLKENFHKQLAIIFFMKVQVETKKKNPVFVDIFFLLLVSDERIQKYVYKRYDIF